MTCLPSLNGCNHNESVSLVETKRGSVEGKVVPHSFLPFFQPNMFIQSWAEPSNRCSETWKCDSRPVIDMWSIDLENPSGNGAISPGSICIQYKYAEKPAVLFPDSSFLSVIMCQATVLVIQGFVHCFIRLHFLSVASQNPAIVIVIISYWVKC